MSARITTDNNITTLRVRAEPRAPPRTTGFDRSRFNKREAAWKADGKCGQCGKPRSHYMHRCDLCQKKERTRWNAAYAPRFHTMRKDKPVKRPSWAKVKAGQQKVRADAFVKRLAGWERVGWDAIEMIKRKRKTQ